MSDYSPERGFGSHNYETHTLSIRFNDPGIMTGIPIWTPAQIGEMVTSLGYVNVTQGWNGTTPTLILMPQGGNPNADGAVSMLLGATAASGTSDFVAYRGFPAPLASPVAVLTLAPWVVCVTATDFTDPVNTTGAATIQLVTMNPNVFAVDAAAV